jgi:FKBP-type peptidyl-prolyl cis-trans isomerase SlyD
MEHIRMAENNQVVADKLVVSLDYQLKLANDEVIDFSEDDAPLEYLHGYKNIIPGLENELAGMALGDEKKVTVKPEQAYGLRDPDSVAEYPRDTFPESLALEVGEPINMRDSESGESFQAFITEIRPETVMLDFNHPLAGETLYFKVKIAGLREPTSEELSHGHVHQAGHDH